MKSNNASNNALLWLFVVLFWVLCYDHIIKLCRYYFHTTCGCDYADYYVTSLILSAVVVLVYNTCACVRAEIMIAMKDHVLSRTWLEVLAMHSSVQFY
jgi:hypothetical protein